MSKPKRDIHGRFVPSFGSQVRTVARGLWFVPWVITIVVVFMYCLSPALEPEPDQVLNVSVPTSVDNSANERIMFDAGYRQGILRGGECTVKIMGDLCREGHMWDWVEIFSRLDKMNPE